MTLPSDSHDEAPVDAVVRGGVAVSEPSAVPDQATSSADIVRIDSSGDEAGGDESAPVELTPDAMTPSKRGNRWAKAVGRARAPRPPRRQLSATAAVYGAALSIMAAMLLGFLADLTFVGALHHNRDQHVAYSEMRLELAKGKAPVGPLDFNGKPLAMGAPIAILDIPQIALHEVVFEGTTSRVLEKGAGHARSTLFPGQPGTSVIMGRRAAYGGPFRDIATLTPGKEFTATTGQGVSTYRVLDVRRAGDPVPAAPKAGDGRLQLITAAGPAFQPSGLLRVDADLVTPAFPAPTVGFNIAPLAASESPLAGDLSVLMVLVLWAQAMVIAAGLVAWARVRWGLWQTWIVGLPLLTALGLAIADRVAQLLPNVM